MILLIIKSYLSILLSVGIGSMCLIIIGLYFIFRKPSSTSLIVSPVKEKQTAVIEAVENIDDLSGIAGDDVFITQLDLARAYIETGQKQLAKNILACVIKQGNATQQLEALQLMNHV